MIRSILPAAFFRIALAICACAFITGSFSVWGQARDPAKAYPAKPVRLIVTFPSGSGADVVGRLVGQKLTEFLGQQVVIDNRAGAGGNIGTDIAAKAEPDGYTIVMCATALVIGPSLYGRRLAYDPVRDFSPISLVVSLPFMLVVNPAVEAHNVRELIKIAKSRPGRLNYASIGSGTMQQIAAELFKSMAGVDMLHIPYRGTAQYVPDLISGRVSMMFSGMPPVLPHVVAGRLRALAVTTSIRSPAAPDVPTIAESGLPGYEASVWFGILAPAKTPVSTIRRLNAEIVRILKIQNIRDQLLKQGAEPVGNTPGEFAAIIKTDMEKYARTVKEANIRIE